MADNTEEFELRVLIKKNLDWLFANDPNVFIAGHLLWYPIKDNSITCNVQDVMVVFGRHKGDRECYLQWEEDNIPPQVVFDISSPKDDFGEIIRKFNFYESYGVEEYYLLDIDKGELGVWLRSESELAEIEEMANWVSPRLGIRFELSDSELEIYHPNGQPFLTYQELARALEQERQRAEQAEAQLQALRALLQERGINPDEVNP